jgi:predicted Rossmann fold nucleotide-binding protein DprA/Smf involved in DNA uptake
MFPPQRIDHNDPLYPLALRVYLKDRAPIALTARGNLSVLRNRPQDRRIALFCSIQCPGAIITQAYELVRCLGSVGVTVISGFHSPMEKECFRTLLNGTSSSIYCPARAIEELRIRTEWRPALDQGRLLLLSSFEDREQRPTTGRAKLRNHLVAALADVVFVAHATPGGKLERFCRDLGMWGKPIFTLATDENANLLTLGAKPVRPEQITNRDSLLAQMGTR